MELAVGSVVEGKVSGITKFGAFVSLEGNKNGLVHISEIANKYVSDVNEYLHVGQAVKVRILNIGSDGKINLSIKRAEEAPPRAEEHRPSKSSAPAKAVSAPACPAPPEKDDSFESRLKRFMQESDSRIADNRVYSEHRQRTRRR